MNVIFGGHVYPCSLSAPMSCCHPRASARVLVHLMCPMPRPLWLANNFIYIYIYVWKLEVGCKLCPWSWSLFFKTAMLWDFFSFWATWTWLWQASTKLETRCHDKSSWIPWIPGASFTNVNPSMDKSLHPLWKIGWDYLSIPKFLGIDK